MKNFFLSAALVILGAAANAQDILATDWGTIIKLCEFIAHHVA